MKVLSIGMDKDLLRSESVSFKRHVAYAAHFEELHAIVFARTEYGENRVHIADNAWAYPTHSTSTIGLFVDAYKLGRKLLKEKGEWVISAQDPFESGLVAFVLARTTGTPFLIQEHGDFFSTKYWRNESYMNRIRTFVGKRLIVRADHVRAVSQRIKRTLVRLGVNKNKITVTPVYTDIEKFQNAEPSKEVLALRPEGGVLLVTMARFVEEKKIDFLIRAFSKVVNSGVAAHLVIVGNGALEIKLKNLATEMACQSITFLDWSKNPNNLLTASDAYVLSSNHEGWGRVCIEALAAGTPLLMTDVGCAGEVVMDGENGLVVPVEDEWAIAEGVKKLATDEELRTRLAKNGMETVQNLPTFEENVELYVQSLATCLKEKRK